MNSLSTMGVRLRFPLHDHLHAALCEIYEGWEPSWEGVPGNSYGIRTSTPDGTLVSWFKPAGKTQVQGRGDLNQLIDALSAFEPNEAEVQSCASKVITPNFRPRSVPNTVLVLYRDLTWEAAGLAGVLRSDGLFPELIPVGSEEGIFSLSRDLERMRERVQFGFIVCTSGEWREQVLAGHAAVVSSHLGFQQVALLVRSERGERVTSEFDLVQEFTFRGDIDEVTGKCRDYLYERVDRDVQRLMKSVSQRRYRFTTIDNEVPAQEPKRKKPSAPSADSTPWEDRGDE